MISQTEKNRFAVLCAADAAASPSEAVGIGVYNEKSLHRIFKRFFATCEGEGSFEVKVGPFVADLLEGDCVTEIQCGPFRPLREKLAYYEAEGYRVTVVHPILADLTILRMDRESGELLRQRHFRAYERPMDVLPLLYDIGERLASGKVTLCLPLLRAEEFRYSERVRYRKSGAYESELFARELLDLLIFRTKEDYRALLPEDLPTKFAAAEFGRLTRLKGRKLYSALNGLIALGLLRRDKEGRGYRYTLLP